MGAVLDPQTVSEMLGTLTLLGTLCACALVGKIRAAVRLHREWCAMRRRAADYRARQAASRTAQRAA